MKKKVICLLLVVLIMVLSINIKSYATTPTLEQIANAFNICCIILVPILIISYKKLYEFKDISKK